MRLNQKYTSIIGQRPMTSHSRTLYSYVSLTYKTKPATPTIMPAITPRISSLFPPYPGTSPVAAAPALLITLAITVVSVLVPVALPIVVASKIISSQYWLESTSLSVFLGGPHHNESHLIHPINQHITRKRVRLVAKRGLLAVR